MNWLRKLLHLPIKLKVEHGKERKVTLYLDCPLCEESEYWPFLKDRHWKPEKGHKDYELHQKLNY
jgi:hypothetical protein